MRTAPRRLTIALPADTHERLLDYCDGDDPSELVAICVDALFAYRVRKLSGNEVLPVPVFDAVLRSKP